MKKSLLAIAALAAVSGSAFAQSSVTMYGRVDQGVGQAADAPKNREVRAGSANRLGFRGVEDLGGGLKAFFQFEHRFDADTGMSSGNGANPFWEGKSFVGVRTTVGDFYLGREDNPAYAISQVAGDPFGIDTVAANTTILNGRIGTNRYANSINYRGTFAGVTLGAQISEADNTKAQSTGEDRPFSLAASYTGGPFTIGVGHENPANENAEWTTVNGAWDFKVVKLIALYGFGNTSADDERRGYILGATAPLGNGEFKLSYGVLENEAAVGGAKTKLDKQIGVGYHYALSKRTTVYADFVNEKRDGIDASGFEKNGFDLGVKHNF